MIFVKYLGLAALLVLNFSEIEGHGRLMDPVNRGSAFKKGFPTPENWDDDSNYCGGYQAHFIKNKGKCGPCGDDYSHKQPRANENGGKYGRGYIVKTYEAGSKIEVNVDITANHLGHFTFALCPLKGPKDLETEECFRAHKLKLATGGRKYPVKTSRKGTYLVKLRLPKGLTCKHCVLRWQYIASNNWGRCRNGEERQGCGDQETFRTCSDITIQ